MSKGYKQMADGEWAEVPRNPKGHAVSKLSCCDCGLVHFVQIQRTRRGYRYRMWRDPRATAVRRRGRRFLKEAK